VTAAVEISGLCRTYDRRKAPPVWALDHVDLLIEPGEIHGLLGPNGAGKTTLCKILATVLLPTAGTARVLGHDVVAETSAVRLLLGLVLGGERGLYGRLSARQNLRYWSALYRQPPDEGLARVEQLLDRVGLADRAGDRVETYSRGMKQRLHLARGLVGDPRLVVLDEPTTGMDPVAGRDFRTLVTELRSEGRTVLVTTHDMAEAEAICDRVSLVDGGRLLATEDPRTIGGWLDTYERVEAYGVPAPLAAELAGMAGVAGVHPQPDGSLRVQTDREGAASDVLRRLLDAGVTAVGTARPSLEEVYLHVIGDRGLAV
jgi:ABC-2 type transport system ATP-binding protein